MHVTAFIMAGGHSKRMRHSFGPTHKALVPVLGVPMVEWNIYSLVRHGIRRIVVASNASEAEIAQYVSLQGSTILGTVGGTITSLIETQPFGTIGAVSELQDWEHPVLVVNVDNLTALNWTDMLAYHHLRSAAMTVAAHWQPFRIPLGEVELDEDNIVKYHEKPWRKVLISSGSYLLSPEACRMIPKGRRMDAPQLVDAVLGSGGRVAAFQHQCPWIDVNDAAAVSDAERLVAENFTALACWHPSPKTECVRLLGRSNFGILLEKSPAEVRGDPAWVLPAEGISQTADRAALQICNRLRLNLGRPYLLGAYDEIEGVGNSVTRNYVFSAQLDQATPPPVGSPYAWIRLEDVDSLHGVSTALLRSVKLLTALP